MKIVAAYDSNPEAVATYNANWESVAQVADLARWQDFDIPDCDGIIAGPPCQDASRIAALGRHCGKNTDLGRSNLLVEVARIIAFKRPAWALLENVVGIVGRPEFGLAQSILIQAGYWIQVCKLNHADFGGLTTRERVFLTASKTGLPLPVGHLSPRDYRAHGPAIEPLLREREPDGWRTSNLRRLRIHEAPSDATFNVQYYGSWRTWRGWDEPYFTVTASTKAHSKSRWKGQVWKLGNAEMSLLQGFPPRFAGLTTSMIGNAVPPELARAWGRVIRSVYGDDQHIVSLFCGAGGFDFIQEAA